MRKLALAAVLLAGSCAPPKPAPKLESRTTPEGYLRSKVVAKGTSYLPSDYLVPGYVTVLEFMADW